MAQFDDLAPRYQIEVNGIPLQEDVLAGINSVEFSESEDLMDEVRIKLDNVNTEGDYRTAVRPRFSDSKVLAEGNVIDLFMGYGDVLDWMTRCEVVNWEPDFPKSAVPTLDVIAFSGAHRMASPKNPKHKTKNWRDAPHSDFVAEIARSYKFGTDNIENTKLKKFTPQASNISDFEFIKTLAEFHGFEFFVTFNTQSKRWDLYFRTPEVRPAAVYNLFYDKGDETTLFSFKPDFTLSGVFTEIELVGWDEERGIPIIIRIVEDKEGEKAKFTEGGTESILSQVIESGLETCLAAEFGKRIKVITAPQIADEPTAQALAESILRRGKEAFLSGRGQTVGIEKIRARQVHNLLGLGNRFSGKYLFAEVNHKMPGDGIGYSLDFRARKIIE